MDYMKHGGLRHSFATPGLYVPMKWIYYVALSQALVSRFALHPMAALDFRFACLRLIRLHQRIPHLTPKTTPRAAAPDLTPQTTWEADSPLLCISGLRRPNLRPNSRQAAQLPGSKLKIGLTRDLKGSGKAFFEFGTG